jgi:hypothetical protein
VHIVGFSSNTSHRNFCKYLPWQVRILSAIPLSHQINNMHCSDVWQVMKIVWKRWNYSWPTEIFMWEARHLFSQWGLVSKQAITGLSQLELELRDVWFIEFLLTRNTVTRGINWSTDVPTERVFCNKSCCAISVVSLRPKYQCCIVLASMCTWFDY